VTYENNMPVDARNKLLARIDKLMAMRDDGNSPEEAELAAVRVQELLTRIGLTEAEVRAQNAGAKQKIVTEQVAWIDDVKTTWEINLATCIANACFCEVVLLPAHACFIGTEIDSASAGYMWSNLAYKLDAMSQTATTEYARQYKKETGKSAYKTLGQAYLKRYRRNWLSGAVAGIWERLVTARKAAITDNSNITALVVLKQQDTTEAMHVMFPRLRFKKYAFTDSNEEARAKGYQAGKEVELQKGLPGARAPLTITG